MSKGLEGAILHFERKHYWLIYLVQFGWNFSFFQELAEKSEKWESCVPVLSSGISADFLKCKSQFLKIKILVSKRKIFMERKWNVRGAVSPFLIILSISKTKIACFGLPQVNAVGFLCPGMHKTGFS